MVQQQTNFAAFGIGVFELIESLQLCRIRKAVLLAISYDFVVTSVGKVMRQIPVFLTR